MSEQFPPQVSYVEPPLPPRPEPAARRGPGMLAVVTVATVVSLIVGGFAGIAGYVIGRSIESEPTAAAAPTVEISAETAAALVRDPGSIAAIAESVIPSVVSILIDGRGPDGQGSGSGFVIRPDGYILTNNHVVADADEIIVRLSDRSEMKAKLVGTDPRSDVALLKIEGKNLPVLKLGKSQDLKAGQWVVAIGSPFGFDHTVTQGIISAMGRSLPNESYVPFIQTDVPINPGNSGGPLFNLAGEVVGINSQIYTRSGGFMGVSFAIPIDVAMDVSNQLKAGGKVSRGWLGVVIQEVNKDLAESFGLDKPAGALVAQIQDDGPAAKGGLQVGDVILTMNGQPIVMSADLPHLVGALKAGSKAKLEVIREGKRQNVELTVGAIPEEGQELGALGGKSGAERSSNRLGIAVVELTDEQKKSFDLKSGVVIKEVQDGPAALIGLQPGDVITHLNNQAIDTTKEFADIAKALPKNRSVSMRVLRQGRASFITFKLAE